MSVQDEKRYMTLQEAATELRVAPNTMRRLLQRGDIPAMKVGRAWRISREAIRKLIEGER